MDIRPQRPGSLSQLSGQESPRQVPDMPRDRHRADTPKAAGIYCRLSFAEDGSEEKVDRQEADCRALADRLAWPISEAHVFKDNNRSAWQRNRKRPGWDRLLQAIKGGEIDSVIVYHGDRLIRQSFDLETLIIVANERGIRIASPSGTRDLGNPDDLFILRIEVAQACRASDDTSRRVKRGLAARAAKGLPVGTGRRAFGFERDNITHKPDEARLIVQCAERLLAGQSVYGVVQWLNSIGSRGTGGALWQPVTFKEMIARPRIAGLRLSGGVLIEAAWKPILDIDTWTAVRHLLETRAEAAEKTDNSVRYLLSGIARCGTCTSAVVVRNVRTWDRNGRKRPKYKTYHCMNTQCALRVTRSVKNLDAYVTGRVLGILNDPEFIAALYAGADDGDASRAGEIAELERRKAAVKHQLEHLADFPDVDVTSAVVGLASFDGKIAKLRERSAASSRARFLARMIGMTPDKWEALPLDLKRQTVKMLFTVTVLPTSLRGRGFKVEDVVLKPVEED